PRALAPALPRPGRLLSRPARPGRGRPAGQRAAMRVLVTGGAGQIGSTVIDLLLERGDSVLAIDNFAPGRRDNLARHANLVLVEDTIADAAVVDRLMAEQRPDAVLHAAASYKDPDDWATDALVNTVGTAIVARACRTNRVARLVYL